LHNLLECGCADVVFDRLKPGRQRELAVEPGLEHEDVPEVEVPVAGAGELFLPFLAAGGGVEVAFAFEAGDTPRRMVAL
jgi:hypothetical protein